MKTTILNSFSSEIRLKQYSLIFFQAQLQILACDTIRKSPFPSSLAHRAIEFFKVTSVQKNKGV